MEINCIKELRIKHRMTQQELGKVMGLTAAAVSRHENHQRSVDEATAANYQKVLGGCWKRS